MMSGRVVGVILAGGLSRRMGGGDKALLELGGKTILARVIERLAPQVEQMVLNANGDPARFAEFGLPVAPDPIEGFAGPLAGVLAGLDWAHENAPDLPWVVTVASDTPFFPEDLVPRFVAAADGGPADLVCAGSGGRAHPVFGLWPVKLREDLRRAMIEEDIRKVDAWTGRHALTQVDFADERVDPFFNANRPEDLGRAEELLGEMVP